MTAAQIIAIAQGAATIVQALAELAATRREAMTTTDRATLDGLLDKIHADSLAIGARLDAAAAEAEKQG